MPQLSRSAFSSDSSMFKDPLHPTENELRNWGNDPGAEYPDEMRQDWDLILANFNLAPILIKLVCEGSANSNFFLSCLYILSGDCVRGSIDNHSIQKVKSLFELVPPDPPAELDLWVIRSKILFNNPEQYDNWFSGD